MSNIGKKLIAKKEGVTVLQEGRKVVVTGSKGTLEVNLPQEISLEINDDGVKVKKTRDSKDLEKYLGLSRALIANMVEGVSNGFEKKLELSGVGYRARVEGGELILNVGFALPVRIKPIDGTLISVTENIITVSGINKQLVGDVAANIKKIRKPDPYKGKGIKYFGEKLRRKVGKAAKAVGGK